MALDGKYHRYSTDQLEVLLPHLTDPQEREAVKAELGRRYYEHYLRLAQETGTMPSGEAVQQLDGGPSVQEQPEAGEGSAVGEATDGGEDLGEISPIPLPTMPPAAPVAEPVSPSKAAGTADKRCFIATAAYASPQAPQVQVLRRFRDRCLVGRPWGQKLLHLYYQISPALAVRLASRPARQRLARLFLSPLALYLELILTTSDPRPSQHRDQPE